MIERRIMTYELKLNYSCMLKFRAIREGIHTQKHHKMLQCYREISRR